MKNLSFYLVFAVINFFTSSVQAEGLRYTFFSADYGLFNSKVDTISESLDGDGYAINLSYAVRPHIALTAGYIISNANIETDGMDITADIDAYSFGILVHFPINKTSDFIITAAFTNGKADVSVDGGPERSVDEDGGVVSIGFRAMASDSIEINGFLQRNSIEESTSISIDLGASYYLIDSLSIDTGYRVDSKDGSDLLTLGFTFYF